MKIRVTKGCVVKMAARSTGDEIEVSGREGRLLIAMGKAVEVLQVKAKAEPVEPKAAPKKKRSRKKLIED